VEKFSKSKAIAFGWEVTKKNFWFFLGLLIIVFLVQDIPASVAKSLHKSHLYLSVAIRIVAFIINTIISIGLVKISLKLYGNSDKPRFSDLFSYHNLFFKYFFANVLFILGVCVGLMLLIVPGFILLIKCQFYGYLVVDKGMGPLESLKRSFAITRGNFWNLALFDLLVLGICSLGILAFLIGLFVALPITLMATVFVYRFLIEKSESLEPAKTAVSPTLA
jgi:uncharacterized membrane protein